MDSVTRVELTTGILAASAIIIGGAYYFSPSRRKLRRIPGPKGYPVVGSTLQMELTKPHESLRKWAKEYGGVMKVNFFGEDIIVVNSYEGITELMLKKSNNFAGRPSDYRYHLLFDDTDVLLTDLNPKWSYMKKASMTGLKQVGEQIAELEDMLQGFLDDIVKKFRSLDGKSQNVYDDVNAFVLDATFTLVFGRELLEKEHKEVMVANIELSETFNPTSDFALLAAFPLFRGFWNKQYRTVKKLIYRCRELFKKHASLTVEKHDNEIKCILDGMIQEMKQPKLDKIPPITFGNIYATGINLIGAGTLTTSSALYFFISLMAANPDIQEEAHENVVKAIGDRTPSLNDRFAIPYIESMILEFVRLMSHVPVSVPHKTLQDVTLQGYEIPKGTQIWPNLWNLHHDEKLWEDPWEFKPKRFLDENGDLLKADHPLRKQFLAFGAGRRVCVGESLAKHRMFLFVVTMLQNFVFKQPEGDTIITDPREFELGFVLMPPKFNVQIQVRQ